MQQADQLATRKEYLQRESESDIKFEFYQGKIYAMTGGTFNHSFISGNIFNALKNRLHEKSCQPMNSDMRVHTPAGLDTYPDISVYCGQPELGDEQKTLMNPVVIVEVLSPTTSSYDRGDKFALYRATPSLQDYILVDSEQVLIEHFCRIEKGGWIFREYTKTSENLPLTSLEVTLPLAEIYAAVTFEKH